MNYKALWKWMHVFFKKQSSKIEMTVSLKQHQNKMQIEMVAWQKTKNPVLMFYLNKFLIEKYTLDNFT